MTDRLKESSVIYPHMLQAGGAAMKVKHTHPSYSDHTERMERLKDLKQNCRVLVQTERKEKRVS